MSTHSKSFRTTQWTLLSVIRQSGDTAEVSNALETICNDYWYPLFVYLRSNGLSSHDAEDVLQSFFVVLLENDTLRRASKNKGKLRTFLLTVLKRHQVDLLRKEKSLKRGGGVVHFSMDIKTGDERYHREPSNDHTAEELYHRRWARTLISTSLKKLREEFESKGKSEYFEALKDFLSFESERNDYSEASKILELSENHLRVTVHRMRAKYREILLETVRQTLDCDPTESDQAVKDELMNLFSVT